VLDARLLAKALSESLGDFMSFETTFTSYLNDAFRDFSTSEIQGFCFNLFEPAGNKRIKFGLEIIGSSQFDFDDKNWPCEECWEPEQRQLMIPVSWSGEEWEECLLKVKNLIINRLNSKSYFVKDLKSAQGIGVGFVDGELEVLWKNT